MTALLFQTLLLMVPAFFVGAALACGLRKLLSPAEARVPAATRTPVRAAAGPVDPLPQYATRDIAPGPVAAKPPTTTSAAVPTAAVAANRFDEALKGRATVAPTAVAEPPEAPAATAPVVKVLEPAMRPAPPPPAAPKSPVPAVPSGAPVSAATIASAAAAAAAAAAAVAQQAKAAAAEPFVTQTQTVEQAAKPVAKPVGGPVPSAVPAAAATTASTPATLPAAASPATTSDDLTRISGIDEAIAEKLHKLGVTRFSHIAGWYKSDVASTSRSLGLDGRVEQENWIEQAQILASGGETYYSGRRAQTSATESGLSAAASTGASDKPAAANPAPAEAAAAPLASGRSEAKLSGAAAAASAAIAAAAASASQPRVHERAAFSTSPAARDGGVVVPPPAPTTTPPPVVEPKAVAAAPGAASAPDDAAPATPVRPAMAPTRDVLQRIGGINAEIERLLAAQNVTRYGQIANWGTAELERFDRLLGSQGRISRENWVEQAQVLSKGGDTAHSREYDRRNAEVHRDAVARPKSITDAIRNNAGAGSGNRADIVGLRSVKSEAYRTDAATASAAAAAAAAGSAKVVRSAEIDDLKRIRGIGVLIEKRLNSVGVVSYDQVADWTTDDIDRVSASLDFKGRIERENWVEQARILAAGGQTEFSRRVDRGEVETSKPKPS